MRKWWPLALLGLSGLGMILFSERKAVGPFGESLVNDGDDVADVRALIDRSMSVRQSETAATATLSLCPPKY